MVLLSLSVIFKSVWYVQDFEYTSACDAHVRLKTKGTAIKIAKETTNDQQKKYNSVHGSAHAHLSKCRFCPAGTCCIVYASNMIMS